MLVLLLGIGAAQAATTHAGRVKARRAYQRALIKRLASHAQPQPLLGAALLARTGLDEGGPLGFHQLIERAAAAPGAGPAQNWLRLSDCDAQADNCPNPAALKALLRQAPDNAAVWMLRMGQAASLDEAAAAKSALRHAAQARTYDDYAGQSLQALARAVALLPPPAAALSGQGSHATQVAALRVTLVFGIGQAQSRPGFQWIAARCKPQAVNQHARRRPRCLQLADVLVRGSSPLARSLGLHLRATLSRDAVTRAQAHSDMQDLVWQVSAYAQLQARARTDIKVARRLLELARRGGTQMAQMLAALHAFGLPAKAPQKDARPAPALVPGGNLSAR